MERNWLRIQHHIFDLDDIKEFFLGKNCIHMKFYSDVDWREFVSFEDEATAKKIFLDITDSLIPGARDEIIPRNNQIVLKAIELEEKKKSVLILTAEHKQPIYQVVETHTDSMYSIRDKVIIKQYEGQAVVLDKEEFILINEDFILAMIYPEIA